MRRTQWLHIIASSIAGGGAWTRFSSSTHQCMPITPGLSPSFPPGCCADCSLLCGAGLDHGTATGPELQCVRGEQGRRTNCMVDCRTDRAGKQIAWWTVVVLIASLSRLDGRPCNQQRHTVQNTRCQAPEGMRNSRQRNSLASVLGVGQVS